MAATTNEAPLVASPVPHAVSGGRLNVLDGWRAVSIVAVIAGHWLPFNAFLRGSNEAIASGGMAIFFTLSGFLITRFLLDRPEIRPFVIRRFLRIVPLAWVAVITLYIANPTDVEALQRLLANLLFYANLPPQRLFEGGSHLWSLCVEMQFYVATALIVGFGGRRALYALPILGLVVTLLRVWTGSTINIVTWLRVDEIMAGATLSLIYAGRLGLKARVALARLNFWVAVTLAVICCYFMYTPLAYARPYAVAAMVGVTLFHAPPFVQRWLSSRLGAYIAEISYALYVIHGMLGATWLGSGDVIEKYLKRPLLLAATVVLAHLSTFYFERRFIQLAKLLTRRNADLDQKPESI